METEKSRIVTTPAVHYCNTTKLHLYYKQLIDMYRLYLVVKLFGSRRFLVAAPRVWNSLPQELRNCENLDTFEKHLKTHLFRQDII